MIQASDRELIRKLVKQLVKRHGAKHREDIERGVRACERVWDSKSGSAAALEAFCLEQYVPPGKARTQLLLRLDEFHHDVWGCLELATKSARAGSDIADRPLIPAERILSSFSPRSHLSEDYRKSHIAALAQLNFGARPNGTGNSSARKAASKSAKTSRSAAHGATSKPPKSRVGWAARRLGELGREYAPAELISEMTRVQSAADRFISSYNLHLHNIDFGDPRVRFSKGPGLVSHWGLRDYMTDLNGQKDALPKQRAILDLMRRVVDGEIPLEMLGDPKARWNIPKGTITSSGTTAPAKGHGPARWAHFREIWKVHRKLDRYRRHGNYIDDKFLVDREIPEETIVGILTEIVSSPLAERVAKYISGVIGRDLEPFDIYYRGFLDTGGAVKEPLRYDIKKRYPSARALNDAIVDVLVKLGWKRDRARWIRDRIRVDNGRSAGHAWPPGHESDVQLLRVRVDKSGCDEMNFETYMHELGHCVEGVLSSYEMDYKVLWGVPNTAFTEGFAFTFQDRADEILGRKPRAKPKALPLLRFWEPFEIAGNALTEIRLFRWLYEHPNATARQIMKAVRAIGDEIWDAYYARVLGPKSFGLMSVYSHMLWGDLYLAEYPLGYVIAYQVRKFLEGKPLAREMERMCALGAIEPNEWLKAAVGEEISVEPLLRDTKEALDSLGV